MILKIKMNDIKNKNENINIKNIIRLLRTIIGIF